MTHQDHIRFTGETEQDLALRATKSYDKSAPIARTRSAAPSESKEWGAEFEEEAPVDERDYKKKQTFKGWLLLWLAYQSTGVIYGDIGTSPLYVYSSTFSDEPSHEDLLGALSLIIWSITLIVTVKYVFIVLCADDEGEGGTFAIYNLLSRYSNIQKHDPKMQHLVKFERYETNEITPASRGMRTFLEKSRFASGLLKTLAVFGVSLILADSILTPAQSVLGAIQGLKVVDENISNSVIIGVSCAILVVLFVVQPLGIARLGSVFAPIVIIWLIFNLCFGIYNLALFDYTVLKAFSPYFAGQFFVRNGTQGWISLGGILLAFTGVEALFADLGAFSKRAVQLSWLGFAYPCLLMAYIGQAANISMNPGAFANPFFNTVPPGMFWPSLVISILAAIVASQAMITSTFQLLSQVMSSSYFPHIRMIYTSDRFHGQVYIPIANWLMMIGTVIVTAVYNNTTSLGHAYGFCVIFVTFITSNLVYLVAIIVWRINWVLATAIWLPFVTLDGLFLSSAATKVPDGAWFTLLLAIILSCVFILWRYGKEKQWSAEGRARPELSAVVVRHENGKPKLSEDLGGAELTNIKGLGIFFDKAGTKVPAVYEEFLKKFQAKQEVHVFLHLRALAMPIVADEDKYQVTRTSVPDCYRMILRHGYNDRPIRADLGNIVYLELRKAIIRSKMQTSPGASTPSESTAASATGSDIAPVSNEKTFTPQGVHEVDKATARRIVALDEAYKSQVVYVVGKEELRLLKESNNIFKRIVLGAFLWIRENTRAKIAQMNIPVEKLVEVGFVKEL